MKRVNVILAGALVALFALPGSLSDAQNTGAVRGKVVDEKGQALEGAKVTVEFEGGVTRKFDIKTNKKGEFTQVGMPPGMYKITAGKDGYQGTYLQLKVGIGEPTELGELKLNSAAAAAQKQGAAGSAKAAELTSAFSAAYELVQANKLDEAKAAYEAILAKEPSVAQAHYNLGFIAGKKSDWAAAEASYKKALELKPDYAEAYSALAEVYQSQGDAAKAQEFLTQAAAQQSDNGALLYQTGAFLFNRGKAAEAKPFLEKALAADPQNAETYFLLGTVAVQENNVAKAVEHLEKYLAMNPKNAQNVQTAQGLVSYLKPKK
jgi:Tfp pilus assembly protein PilF